VKFAHNLHFIGDSFPGITFGSDPATINALIFNLPMDERDSRPVVLRNLEIPLLRTLPLKVMKAGEIPLGIVHHILMILKWNWL
jgi:hypothetical protein